MLHMLFCRRLVSILVLLLMSISLIDAQWQQEIPFTNWEKISVENASNLKRLASLYLQPASVLASYSLSHFEISPDGKTLALHYHDISATPKISQQVQLWDVETQTLKAVLVPEATMLDTLVDIFFSFDGKYVVTVARHVPNVIRLWEVETGKEINSWTEESGTSVLAFSPTNQILAFSRSDNEDIVLWDIKSNQEFKRIRQPQVSSIAFNPQGDKIAIGRLQGEVSFWDMLPEGGDPITTFYCGERLPIINIIFSLGGKVLACLETSINMYFRDVTAEGRTISLPRSSVAWDADLKTTPYQSTFAFSDNGIDKLVNIESGKTLSVLEEPTLWGLNPDETIFATTDSKDRLRLRSVLTGAELVAWKVSKETRAVADIKFSPMGNYLAVYYGDMSGEYISLWGVPSANL